MDKEKLAKLFQSAPKEIKDFLTSKELDATVIAIASKNKLPLSNYTPLKNIAAIILLGGSDPDQITTLLTHSLEVSESVAKTLAKDIDETVFNRVRGILGTGEDKVREVKIASDGSLPGTENLRSALLKPKEPVFVPTPLAQNKTESQMIGSRTELLEQLALIGQVPKDSDVIDRLNKIRSQLDTLEEGERQKEEEMRERVQREKMKGSNRHYSKEYLIDPYREQF